MFPQPHHPSPRRRWILSAMSVMLAFGVCDLQAAKANVLIVAVGDSTTAGTPYFKSPLEVSPEGEGDPEGQYTYWMMRKRPQWNVLNHGIAGETSMQIRLRFENALKRHPRYLLILAGVNDIVQGVPVKEVTRQLMLMYQQTQGQSIMPVAATVLPFNTATPEQAKAIRELNAWIRGAAEGMRIPLADFNAIVRDPKNPDRLKDSPDGLHPDIGGYRQMGMVAVDALDPIEKAWR